jgi:hypothetical protein
VHAIESAGLFSGRRYDAQKAEPAEVREKLPKREIFHKRFFQHQTRINGTVRALNQN